MKIRMKNRILKTALLFTVLFFSFLSIKTTAANAAAFKVGKIDDNQAQKIDKSLRKGKQTVVFLGRLSEKSDMTVHC